MSGQVSRGSAGEYQADERARWWSVGSAFPTMEVTIRGSASWLSEKLATTIFLLGFPGSSAGKESASNAGDLGSIPGLGRSLEKGKATHSSILAWRIPWTLSSMESQRVGHD